MAGIVGTSTAVSLDSPVVRIVVATPLGPFLGLEREIGLGVDCLAAAVDDREIRGASPRLETGDDVS